MTRSWSLIESNDSYISWNQVIVYSHDTNSVWNWLRQRWIHCDYDQDEYVSANRCRYQPIIWTMMHLVGPCHRMPSVCLFGGCRIVEDLLITWEGWWGLSNGYSYKTKNARLRIFSNLFSTNYRLSLTWDFCPHPPITPLHPNHIFIRDFPDYALLDHQAPTNSLILLLFLLTLDFFCLVRVDTWFSEVTD